jgi:hypothetical protein
MPYPAPALACIASSPMKKSRSSVPRFWARCPPPGPAVDDDKNPGFAGGGGLFDVPPGA